MFQTAHIDANDKPALYAALEAQIRHLLSGEHDLIANAANFAALVWQQVPAINWCGFYLLKPDGDLLVGPFQGKPACVRITIGRGVCGTAPQRLNAAQNPRMDCVPLPGRPGRPADVRSRILSRYWP